MEESPVTSEGSQVLQQSKEGDGVKDIWNEEWAKALEKSGKSDTEMILGGVLQDPEVLGIMRGIKQKAEVKLGTVQSNPPSPQK